MEIAERPTISHNDNSAKVLPKRELPLGDLPKKVESTSKQASPPQEEVNKNIHNEVLEAPVLPVKVERTEEEEAAFKKSQTPDWMKGLVNSANAISAVLNGAAALTSGSSKQKSVVGNVEKLSEWGNKISFGINSIFNAANGYFDKNIFNLVGYSGEFLITTLMPEKIMGLIRGLSFPTYQMRNILSSVEAFDTPKTFTDEANMIKSRAGKAMKMIFTPSTYTWKNLSKDGGKVSEMLLGAWGGILSAAGVGAWAVTGSTKLGGWMKGIGEAMIDAYQIAPIQWKTGKKFYISSGFAFLGGSICEIIGRQKNDDPTYRNLYFMGSSIGRMLMTLSNTFRESENKNIEEHKHISNTKPLVAEKEQVRDRAAALAI